MLHFLGEVEVVFGLWAVVLLGAIAAGRGWDTATHYFSDTVNYTEALFVVVIMALASTRPVVAFAEAALQRVAQAGGGTPGRLVGGDPDHRPAARLVHHRAGRDDDLRAAARAAVLRPRQPSTRLKYATLGLLFVNVSIGGTLTHFAAPPVLMVARPVGLGHRRSCSTHFGWRAVLAIVVVDRGVLRRCSGRELRALVAPRRRSRRRAAGRGRGRRPAPAAGAARG